MAFLCVCNFYFHVSNLVFLLCACTPKLLCTYMFVHLHTDTNIRICFLCILITLWYAPALVVSWNSSTSVRTSIWHRQATCCSIDGILFFYVFSLGTTLLYFHFTSMAYIPKTKLLSPGWKEYICLCVVYIMHILNFNRGF